MCDVNRIGPSQHRRRIHQTILFPAPGSQHGAEFTPKGFQLQVWNLDQRRNPLSFARSGVRPIVQVGIYFESNRRPHQDAGDGLREGLQRGR